MSDQFFQRPILNSPYGYPSRHWELDESGQPTQKVTDSRRRAEFLTPIPKPKKQKSTKQAELSYNELSSEETRYHSSIINGVRDQVDRWRRIPNPADWKVTPETARLLQHWRSDKFSGVRPFFCQVEAVETAIWLTEVAPQSGVEAKKYLEHLDSANEEANPGLSRLALKLATGAGKTTVMAMLIAWQTINAVRKPGSKRFTRGFLVVAPGLTIRDRLQVLQPNDPNSYYQSRELVPSDLMMDLVKAKIVITNYHAFKQRERLELSKGGRLLLQGRQGEELDTAETEGQMLQRVMKELMGLRNVMVINDEAHHCYQEKPIREDDEEELTGDDKKEAEDNNEAARLWINGLHAVQRQLGITRVMDLSATPFFLRGSGYIEGTLFPWSMSDFSLMDAIECGIVKLPRVPIADNLPNAAAEMPKFRELWKHIGKKMPKKGRGKASVLDPLSIPVELQTALEALYGHYTKTYEQWQAAGVKVPPCFIVVCNNTSTSKLVYDYISGFEQKNEDGSVQTANGRLELFRNYNEHGDPLPRPRTLLIDSEQLESGEALDDNFRDMAGPEIEQFKREVLERGGPLAEKIRSGKGFDDAALLREVMNTVGKEGRLGEGIRCVVSVSMLTEGWDTNTVTHVLGVRAFGTQLLCEQVIGRALRRLSYDLNEEGLFNVEYADVLGIPFDFTAEPVVAPPQKPRQTIQVKAVRPERDALEIRFPRVQGYRVELPEDRLEARFGADSVLELTPDLVGPSITRNSGIIGEAVDLSLQHLGDMRQSTLLMHLTKRLLYTKWRDPGEEAKLHLFGQLKRLTKQWLDECLVCKGGCYPAQLMYQELADMACERITKGIVEAEREKNRRIKAVLDPYNPTGSTAHVNFSTSKLDRWEPRADRSHINWIILDSDWEAEFCRVAENHPKVRAYVKNHNLGLEVPYLYGSETRQYRPDFIVLIDDGQPDPLHLIVEIKGYGELAATICDNIGKVVGAILPAERNPYTELVSWVSGTSRSHAVEIFTTNYDLLFEEAFERARAPYFDGFSGGNSPFFDPVTVAGDDLPSRWSRLWKLHGSIGWALENNSVVRSGGRNVTQLVYPDHLKYDLTQKQPYAALFERLKHFLLTPDTLILATGFSFRDAHVCAVLDETLAMNANTAVFAFQYEKLEGSSPACVLAQDHPNFSVYAPNGAVIRGVMGEWRVGDPPKHWADIRASYWDIPTAGTSPQFLLGNFASFARFCALAQASDVVRDTKTQEPKTSAPIKDNNEPVPEATQ